MQNLIDTQNTKVIIFDLCGVLIDVVWEDMTNILKKNHVEVSPEIFRKISEEVFQLQKHESIEAGVDIFLKKLGLENNKQLRKTQIDFLNNWGGQAKPNFKGISLLKFAEARKIKTAVLSNVFPIRERWKKTWGIDNIDRFFFSYETGILKPQKQAFLNVTNHFKVEPEECLMIGDSNKKDIEPAKALGMDTLYFGKGAAEQAAALQALTNKVK